MAIVLATTLGLACPTGAEQADSRRDALYVGTDPLLPLVEALFYAEPTAALNLVTLWEGSDGWDVGVDLNFLAQHRLVGCVVVMGVSYHPFTRAYSGLTVGFNLWGWPSNLTNNNGELGTDRWALSLGAYPSVGVQFFVGETFLVTLENGFQFSFAQWSLFNNSTLAASSMSLLRPALNLLVRL